MSSVERYEHLYSTRTAFLRYPAEWVVRLYHLRLAHLRGRRALDYGFGSGNNAAFLLARGWTVDGLEVSEAALRLARVNGARALRAQIVPPDLARLPYEDTAFDFVLANQSLYYLTRWGQLTAMVREFHRVLVPGGVVAVSLLSRANSYAGGRGGRIRAALPPRLDGPPEDVWALTADEAMRLFRDVFAEVALGYYDSIVPPKGSNAHHLVIATK